MIDYLSFGVFPLNYMEAITPMLDDLTAKKELAKDYQINKLSDKIIITISDMDFEVMPNGANGYAFILHNSEFQIQLMQYESKNPNFCPVKVYIKSEALWSRNPLIAYCFIYNWLEDAFGEIVDTKISRMDLCCHADTIQFEHIDISAFKGNFKKNNIHLCNRNISGIEFGVRSSLIFCRIYDKQLEVNETRTKLWFYEIWRNCDWNNNIVWNIEFELKRDFFTEFQIDSVEDAFSKIQSIWTHCTENWLVLTDNNRSRIENSSVNAEWQKVSAVFNDFESMPLIKREKQLQAEAEALLPSVVGYLTTYAARINNKNINQTMSNVVNIGNEYLNNKNSSFQKAIQEKIDLLSTTKGGEVIGKTDIHS